MTMTAPLPNRGAISRAAAALGRLPSGTLALGCRYLSSVAGRVEEMTDCPLDATPATVEAHLVRPLLLVDDWPDPTDPLPVGDGAVHADLIDDDREALARLRATFEWATDPERLAAEAQAWRLPVTPYRPLPSGSASPRSAPPRARSATDQRFVAPPAARPTAERRPLADRLVVDLSALWAAPLTTSLLTGLGTRVIKIDPDCRPDGFRDHPALYDHLNGAKEIVDLDLRSDDGRRAFESLVAGADLVVDSFSRRVMPNLGYDQKGLRKLNPSLSTLSIVAFPAGTPEADWVSYGPGVHATSGLGAEPGGDSEGSIRYRPAPIAYPDALAGLAALAVAVELLSSARPLPHREVSLLGAIGPLVDAKRGERASSGDRGHR